MLAMLVEVFNPTASLAATSCPRCGHPGLLQIDHEEYHLTPRGDRHIPEAIIDPSLYVRCPECRVVSEWPGCTHDDEDARDES